MTAHTHSQIVPGCYRCDLGRDEEIASLAEQYFEAELEPGYGKANIRTDELETRRWAFVNNARKDPALIAQLFEWWEAQE